MNDVANQVLKQEMNRVRDALEILFTFHLKSLEVGAKEIAPNLGINFTQMQLIEVDFIPNANFSFEGNFPIFEETYEEQVSVKIGTEKNWWTLYLWDKDIYETKIQERSSYKANIPSFDDLERGWKLQKDRGEIEVLKQISVWCLELLYKFNCQIENFQKEFIDRYHKRLDQAYN